MHTNLLFFNKYILSFLERREKFSKDWVKCFLSEEPVLTAHITDITEGKQYEFRYKSTYPLFTYLLYLLSNRFNLL